MYGMKGTNVEQSCRDYICTLSWHAWHLYVKALFEDKIVAKAIENFGF